MGFASSWLNERALFPEFINDAPDPRTGIIAVVPAYNETEIDVLLDSLAGCSAPGCEVEVIIVINAPSDAPEEYKRNNTQTLDDIESWKKENNDCFFRLFSFVAEPALPRWGVGMARKTGMDEALRRFDAINRTDGVILCLDADCTVERNYFLAVYDELFKRKEHSACSICFEHLLMGNNFPQEIYKSIILYELHLRYHFQGMLYTGFPYVFHTVGSALAVKALPYLKAGGMNRKQAGEDFYFIQKLVPSGGYFSLNSTVVHPSPRTSFRVPFGTGATMQKLSGEGKELLTYSFNAFADLKQAFSLIESFYSCNQDEIKNLYLSLPESIKLFSREEEWIGKITEIQNNTAGMASFRKRFFEWFNMFKTVKYLNFAHQSFFQKKPVGESAAELLVQTVSGTVPDNAKDLLLYYRSLERKS